MIPDCVPYQDFLRKEREERIWLSRRPICCECEQHIQGEECYEIDEGKLVCPACLDEHYKKWTEDYIDCEG